ncbi:hypothetical protein CK203_106350 [Vitis vinifera]|uniref:Uncharacterized protein n=1 Tax=Vitis vinifera TaxID=29760 RepID=A0A438BP02_VITVI|nr:hypothetical protein CK203_106350 [Vitis vinifera]
MYMLNEDVDLQAKMIALTKRLEVLEAKGFHEVNEIYDNLVYMEQCSGCQSIEHEMSDCPTIPTMGERLVENHPNMSWNCGQEQFSSSQYSQSQQFMEDSPQQVSLVEQAVLAISKLTSMHTMQEKGKFSSQAQQNPSGAHEIGETSESSTKEDEVKATITLRGGKEVNEDDRSKEDEIVKEEVKKKDMLLAPPFPKALQSKKVINNAPEIFEVLKQVKVNIPLLDMIRQVPAYAKFLKDLCTIKRGMHLKKKAFLTEQVSAIIQYKIQSSIRIQDVQLSRLVKFLRGIIEDVLIQIDNFYYPIDFVVLDTEQGTSRLNHHGTKEDEELKETYLIELPMEELVKEKVKDNFSKLGEVISNERIEVWRINEEIQPLKLMKWSFSFKKVKTMKHGVHNNSKTMKKKLKE